MKLDQMVRVSRRFQRSIRIDTDLKDPAALDGFICPRSSAVVLETMAEHIDVGQGAFTWTGPYGVGKSSLVIALSALLNGSKDLRDSAADIIGRQTADTVWKAMPTLRRGWRILPVVGSRDRPAQVVGQAIERSRFVRARLFGEWTDEETIDALTRVSKRNRSLEGGLIVFIDEMGRFLEGAAYDRTGIHFFQELAERSSRSGGRLIVVGILHQAFEEYANRLSREMRDEWAKIQGRFVDLAVNASPEEQLDLIGRAIESDQDPGMEFTEMVNQASRLFQPEVDSRALQECWPLHPVVACLLGPISRRRFGQNQRSVFGFLNSMEPHGFQAFLRDAEYGTLYTPDILWDYLKANLEPSIMASPDGHRWTMAVDSIDRCNAAGGSELQVRLLKAIGVIDLFKERSGLTSSRGTLSLSFEERSAHEIEVALAQMERDSFVIHRRFNDTYSIFEGSDFDIEGAVDRAYETSGELDASRLTGMAGLQPVIAKRHYHETGALRWCDVRVVPLRELEAAADLYVAENGSLGVLFLVIPTGGDSPADAERIARNTAGIRDNWHIVVGVPQDTAWAITSLVRDLIALEQVRDETPDLQGDPIARREVRARIADIEGQIEGELSGALESATWYWSEGESRRDQAELNSLASDIADMQYPSAPRIHNELLNRIRPSSNAIAARNSLLRRMALSEGQVRLGIDGYPAEGGLFDSLLDATGLYRETEASWRFSEPDITSGFTSNLSPAWEAATTYLRENGHRTVAASEIYDIWRNPPFGIKDGLMPVLFVALILAERRELALYREGIFQPQLTDLDVDYLSNDPLDVQVRWIDLSGISRQLLSDLAEIVRDMDEDNTLSDLEPIDVARGLVALYDRLPAWVVRTQRLSGIGKRVRQLFRQASDPNKFIFDDIPQLAKVEHGEGVEHQRIAGTVREGLSELTNAYPEMLHRLRETMLTELGVPNSSTQMLAELRDRADNILGISGDHRLEAFILRVSRFEGANSDMESIASMAVNKPPQQWVDSDIERATVELAALARSFVRHEAFAHVRGRQDNRQAMAVVVGLDGQPIHEEFEIANSDQPQVDDLIRRVRGALSESGEEEQNVILAALARVTAEYLEGRRAPVIREVSEE
ncbi:MAG: ATP-binding protein [Dehalococcoidia bacterium]|nr:ATP-binding protein [Dehalococcoidia bacterium]